MFELEKAFAAGGPPKVLRADNGPELVSQALQRFCENKTGIVDIPPGCPWDNGYIESFNNRLRKECLNRNHWNRLFEARAAVTAGMIAPHRGVAVFSGVDRVGLAAKRSTTSARPAKPGAADMSAATRRLAWR